MKTTLALQNSDRFVARLKFLHEQRRRGKRVGSLVRRSLSEKQRDIIWGKTGGRCHICGGKLKKNENWQADHILAHANGGKHSVENYLPAHFVCNNYRWHYGSEEFQWILKLGVWLRTLLEKPTILATTLAEKFVIYERRRIARHKNS